MRKVDVYIPVTSIVYRFVDSAYTQEILFTQ